MLSSRVMDYFSDDMWDVIQDIAREPSLVAVCRRTYRLLRGRHVICYPKTAAGFTAADDTIRASGALTSAAQTTVRTAASRSER